MRRLISISAALGLATIGVMAPALADSPAPGTSAESPIVVTDVSEVPEGAVEDIPSTYMTDNECATTRSWVLTIPGEHHDAVTEVQNQWKRWVEGTPETYNWTLYERTREWKDPEEVSAEPGFWTKFQPTGASAFEGPPTYPTDPRGKWSDIKYNGGPAIPEGAVTYPSGDGVIYQVGAGHGSWFYRQPPKDAYTIPGYYTDWTEWTPVLNDDGVPIEGPEGEIEVPENTNTHEWELRKNAEGNGDGTEGYFEYYVEDGEPTTDEDLASWIPESEDPGEGWDIHRTRTVTIEEAYTDPDVVTYYAWTDGKPCDVVPPTDPKPDPDPVTPTEPQPEPTDPAPVTPTEPEKPATTPKAPVKGELPTLAQTGVGNQVLGMIGGFLLMAGVLLLALRRNAQSR